MHGAHEFVTEFLEALYQSKRRNSLRPVHHVIDAWYRTFLFLRAGAEKTYDEDVEDEATFSADDLEKLFVQ